MNPNDESTLTSFSGNTPVPRENTPCSGTDTEDDEDKMPMKFAQIYTDNLLHHTKTISSHHHDGYTSSFYSKKHNESQSEANSYDSETSQSLAEAAETDTDTTTERDIVVDNEESEYFVPQEVTCQEQEVSFIDTSFELSSPLSQHADRPYDRELPEPRRLQQHCQPEHEYEEVIHQASSAQSERKHSRQEDAKLKPEADTTKNQNQAAFLSLRLTYLIVTLVIMLADGLQGMYRTVRVA